MLIILSVLAALSGSPQASPGKTTEADPVVCTRPRADSEVGTHMRPKKICMRKSDWDYQEKHVQRELQQINNRGDNPGNASGRPNDQ